MYLLMKAAEEKMAIEIAINAKLHRPSVCNAAETVFDPRKMAIYYRIINCP